MADPARILTPAEVADLCRVSLDTVYNALADGTLPARRIGRQWRVHPEELDRWLRGEARNDQRSESGTSSTSSSATGDGGPTSPDDIARLLLLIRRARALRRRGAHTKAVRRARARAYYRTAGEALR